MPQIRGTFPELYDGIDKAVYGVLKAQLKELPANWRQLFNVKTSNKKFERVMTITPFGNVPLKPEGEVYAMDIIKPGYSKDFTHVEFGLGFEVTETALEDDEYDQLTRSAEWLAFSARYVQNLYAMAVFNNGFTTELTPDGESLFDTAHPLKVGGTVRNTPTAAADLSAKALMDALADMQMQSKLESGQMATPVNDLYLVVPPSLEFLGDRILNSAGLPGTADNDRNPINKRRSIDLLVDPLLSDDDTWFLVAKNSRMHGLTTYQRVAPTMAPPATDIHTGNRIYKVRFRQSWGAWTYLNVYGVPGA